jgi:prepilin-type N-terminal cleavage/methylation domain-containing protein
MKLTPNKNTFRQQKGFSLPELIIVVLILAILCVLALPQIIASRRAFSFAGMQRQIASKMTQARQEAMSQRKPVTIAYRDADKKIITYGGQFGAAGDPRNLTYQLSGSGLEPQNIVYGRPGGANPAALPDTSNLTTLNSGEVSITFESDGSVIDSANNPKNNALFFYNNLNPNGMAFGISVLGAGGRVKVWRYNAALQSYVE